MRSSKHLLIYALPTLGLLGTLWALAIWAPGDRAAFFGALVLNMVPLLPLLLDFVDCWERETNSKELDLAEYVASLGAALEGEFFPRERLRISGIRFASTVAAGLWIGVWASQLLPMVTCFILATIALGRLGHVSPNYRYVGMIRMVATLVAAVALGMTFRSFLS